MVVKLELTQDVGTSREVHHHDDASESNNEESLGRGKCSRIPSVKLQDFVTYYPQDEPI